MPRQRAPPRRWRPRAPVEVGGRGRADPRPRLIAQMMRIDLHPAAGPFDPGCLCRPQARRAAGSHPMAYFANIGPRSGPILGWHRLVAVAVLQAPDERTPIGMALA